jgi:hypothetical protein
MSEALARTHIDRFNAAVTGGEWSELLVGLHPGAVMTFVGVPAGPYHGHGAVPAR